MRCYGAPRSVSIGRCDFGPGRSLLDGNIEPVLCVLYWSMGPSARLLVFCWARLNRSARPEPRDLLCALSNAHAAAPLLEEERDLGDDLLTRAASLLKLAKSAPSARIILGVYPFGELIVKLFRVFEGLHGTNAPTSRAFNTREHTAVDIEAHARTRIR